MATEENNFGVRIIVDLGKIPFTQGYVCLHHLSPRKSLRHVVEKKHAAMEDFPVWSFDDHPHRARHDFVFVATDIEANSYPAGLPVPVIQFRKNGIDG